MRLKSSLCGETSSRGYQFKHRLHNVQPSSQLTQGASRPGNTQQPAHSGSKPPWKCTAAYVRKETVHEIIGNILALLQSLQKYTTVIIVQLKLTTELSSPLASLPPSLPNRHSLPVEGIYLWQCREDGQDIWLQSFRNVVSPSLDGLKVVL